MQRWLPRLFATLFLLCMGLRCSAEGSAVVVLDVSGLSGDITSLRVDLTLDGRPPDLALPPLRNDLSHVEIRLPVHTTGDLNIAVSAQGPDGCTAQAGTTQLHIPGPGRYAAAISVAQSVGCQLVIRKLGDGAGTVILSDETSLRFTFPDSPGSTCPVSSLAPTETSKVYPFGTKLRVQPVIDSESRGSYVGLVNGCDVSPGGCEVTIGADTRTIEIVFERDSVCGADAFCWEHPRPQGQTLRKVRGASSKDVLAVGEGPVLHWAGTYWSAPIQLVRSGTLRALVPESVGTGVVLGDAGQVLRLANQVWACAETMGDSRINDAWGLRTGDFWAVGNQGLLAHWDGQVWTHASPAGLGTRELFAIHGSGSNDIWAVGEQGLLLHFDGQSWSQIAFPSSDALYGVFAQLDGSAWVVGDRGISARIKGGQITQVPTGTTARLWTVFSASALETWAAGDGGVLLRYDGKSWGQSESNTRQDLYSIWGASESELWAVGAAGTMLRYNGVFWSESSAARSTRTLYAIANAGTSGQSATATVPLFAVGDQGTVLRYTGADWITDPTLGSVFARTLRALTSPSASETWIVGDSGTIARRD